MAALLSDYEQIKIRLHATKQHLEDTSRRITHLAKSKLEALLSEQYSWEERKTIKPKLKELALQKA